MVIILSKYKRYYLNIKLTMAPTAAEYDILCPRDHGPCALSHVAL